MIARETSHFAGKLCGTGVKGREKRMKSRSGKDSCFAGLFRVISRLPGIVLAKTGVSRAIFLPSLRFLVSAFFILHSTFLFAQAPAWWFARGAVDTNLPANDYALVTQGQLKWMATNAYAEMEAYFDAGSNVAALVGSFSNSNNYYLANIGQVKYVFSFDSAVDSDEDGLPDWQEAGLGTNPYDSDSDDDGLSDGDEVNIYGTDPTNSDTDGDGLSDGWEVEHGKDPLDPDDAEPEVSNMREMARDRIVYHWQLYFGTTPAFTNTPGSAADLNDMMNDLNTLSEKFHEEE